MSEQQEFDGNIDPQLGSELTILRLSACHKLVALSVVAISGLLLAFLLVSHPTSLYAQPISGPHAQFARFLQPPYYGTVRLNSVYDHEYPLYGAEVNVDPVNAFIITSTVRHYDGTRYWNLAYSGHNGIDYDLDYELVRASAPGNVAYAGWRDPANHQAGEGLYVRIRHSNHYHTIYGHMSVLRVRTNEEGICGGGEFSCILGISGNTGHSTGPHLHFELEPPGSTASVNPYGWIGGAGNDPWQNWSGLASHDVWLRYPSITNGNVYPSGAPLTAPPINEHEPGAFTVDDGDTGFVENPASCWTVDNTSGWAGDHRWRNAPAQNPGNCTATWNFPGTSGRYNVFVYVPNNHAATDAAQYTIRHTESLDRPWSKQSAWAAVDQSDYPNLYHSSSWVYVGTYYFSNQYGTDYVRLESTPLNPVADTMMAADAVRFAPVRHRIYLPLVMKCYPAILPATPVLNAISNPTRSPNYAVSWQPASGAATYTLQEATNPNFTGAVTVYTGAGDSWAATNKPVGTYYYRVRATNCAGNSNWSSVRSTTVSPPGWVTITSQNFEGAFPGNWIVWDDNGSNYGEYYWGKRTCRPYAGSYSGWGVGGGAQGVALSCGSNYPHNANGWMVYGPFDLQDALAGELRFKLWLYTELQNDTVFYGASTNGTNFYGYATSGNTQGWVDKNLDLASVPTVGNLLGRSQVWVVLAFSSNGSTAYAEGGYVDDVVLRQCYRECPSGSSASTSGSGQNFEVSVMVTRQRGEDLGAPIVGPQPFVSPLSTPDPFRSPLPVPQP